MRRNNTGTASSSKGDVKGKWIQEYFSHTGANKKILGEGGHLLASLHKFKKWHIQKIDINKLNKVEHGCSVADPDFCPDPTSRSESL